MSSGKVHYRFWRSWAWFIPAGALMWSILCEVVFKEIYWSIALFVTINLGYLLGRWIDPDLDEVGITNAEGRMMSDFKIFGAIMTGYWTIYAYIMRFVGIGKKGHRNFFSHVPLISTMIRLIYLLIPVIIYIVVWGDLYDLEIVGFVGLLVGLTFSDTIHYLLDLFPIRE